MFWLFLTGSQWFKIKSLKPCLVDFQKTMKQRKKMSMIHLVLYACLKERKNSVEFFRHFKQPFFFKAVIEFRDEYLLAKSCDLLLAIS